MANKILGLSSLIHGQFNSQADFAKRVGWSKQKVNKIINGHMTPSISDVQTIAEGLDVPIMMVLKFFLK